MYHRPRYWLSHLESVMYSFCYSTITGEYGGNLILESLILTKIAYGDCSVRYHSHARGTSFLFPKAEVLLGKFFEPNKTLLPHNIPYLTSNLVT